MAERDVLAELYDVTRRLTAAETEDAVLDIVVTSIEEVFRFDTNSVRRADDETGTLSLVRRSPTSAEVVGELPTYDLDGDAPAVRAYRTGAPVVDNHGLDDASGRDPIRTSLYVPLGEYGTLNVGSQSGTFSEEDVDLLGTLADTAAAALRRARKQRAVEELHTAAQQLSRAETEAEIAATALTAARDLLDLTLTTVLLHDPESDLLRPVEYTDGVADLHDLPPLGTEEGIIGRAFTRKQTENHDDVREDPAVVNPETAIRSELVVPLGEHGVLVCDSEHVGAFDGTDVRLAELLGANVEAALDRREREAELRERTREIERQNDRLETFASVLSHDLRGPLNVAEGYLSLARERDDDDDLARVAKAHERMESLITDVLTLARDGEDIGTLAPVDVGEVARTAWESVEDEAATLRLADPPVVRADAQRLRQVLENLLRNSVKHGSTSSRGHRDDSVEHGSTGPPSHAREDGTDHERADKPDAAVTVTVGGLSAGNGFFVADDGVGIPPEERETVFESGYTTGDGGTGIGLEIVEDIIDGHGWSVDVTESDAGGARFEIDCVDVVEE